MGNFKKKGSGGDPAISTASLPDIVFMLLFFFMVTTVMREVELKVDISIPEASEIQKLENRALVNYLYVGVPAEKEKYGTLHVLQIEDDFATVDDVPTYIENRRSSVDEQEVKKLTTSLKVDQGAKMGIITDIKQKLRQSQSLKINYATLESAPD